MSTQYQVWRTDLRTYEVIALTYPPTSHWDVAQRRALYYQTQFGGEIYDYRGGFADSELADDKWQLDASDD